MPGHRPRLGAAFLALALVGCGAPPAMSPAPAASVAAPAVAVAASPAPSPLACEPSPAPAAPAAEAPATEAPAEKGGGRSIGGSPAPMMGRVAVNDKGQHAIFPLAMPLMAGWREVFRGTMEESMAWMMAQRPASPRP